MEIGRDVSVEKATVRDNATALEFKPGIVSFQPNDDLSIQTSTTIEIYHPEFFPESFFEYQHSRGQTADISIRDGFRHWAQLDLPVIFDAIGGIKSCTAMEMKFPNGRNRQVILGPIQYYGPTLKDEEGGEEHPPFCRCCLFTKIIEAFKAFVEGDGSFALRLYAAQSDGQAQADCRVNGEDYEVGKKALIQYAKSWPVDGTQFRKQYVIIREMNNSRPRGIGEPF